MAPMVILLVLHCLPRRHSLFVFAMTKLMIVGEAWGREEEEAGLPFVGASGRLLNAVLAQVGIRRDECYVTNVFNLRPPGNNLDHLCGTKAEALRNFPPLKGGKWVRASYQSELDRLFKEINDVKPNLILALGATAAWALLRSPNIGKTRGTTATGYGGYKVLGTYHPAAVLRDFSLRPIFYADLNKVKAEQDFPEIRRPRREIWIEPSLQDLEDFYDRYIEPSPDLSIDIETAGDQITCVGFAPTTDRALVVPFFDYRKPDMNYWPSADEEYGAWYFVHRVCALNKNIVGQNFLYDMHFLWRRCGIPVPHATDDTMLLHHALQPEMEKGLGFLGSIYCNEPSWKLMRKETTIKKGD